MEVSISLACFYRTSYPSFPGRVCRSAPPINVPLLLVLPRAHFLWQAVGMLCWQESLLDGCVSGVTACRRTNITSSSGVRIMFYSKLVEYLTSCSWPGPCPDTYQVGLPFLLVLYMTCPDQAEQEFSLVSYTSSILHVERSRLLAFRMKKRSGSRVGLFIGKRYLLTWQRFPQDWTRIDQSCAWYWRFIEGFVQCGILE